MWTTCAPSLQSTTTSNRPAEVLYAAELAALAQADEGPRPPGCRLSLPAVRRFLLCDPEAGTRAKFVGAPSLIDRARVTLATSRGLLLIGEPGTAKSLPSELLAAAVSGDSTLTIRGGAATTEDQIKYSWNYALLINEGPTPRALVAAPVHRGMTDARSRKLEFGSGFRARAVGLLGERPAWVGPFVQTAAGDGPVVWAPPADGRQHLPKPGDGPAGGLPDPGPRVATRHAPRLGELGAAGVDAGSRGDPHRAHRTPRAAVRGDRSSPGRGRLRLGRAPPGE